MLFLACIFCSNQCSRNSLRGRKLPSNMLDQITTFPKHIVSRFRSERHRRDLCQSRWLSWPQWTWVILVIYTLCRYVLGSWGSEKIASRFSAVWASVCLLQASTCSPLYAICAPLCLFHGGVTPPPCEPWRFTIVASCHIRSKNIS